MNKQTQQFFTIEFINLSSLQNNLGEDREQQRQKQKIYYKQISIKKPTKKINKIHQSGPKPSKNRQPPRKISDDMEDELEENQNNQACEEISDKIIQSIFDQVKESVNKEYIKLAMANKQYVPIRVVKGEVYRTEFHQKFSFDVLQILIFQSYQDLSWEWKNYVKQKIVEQNLFAIFVNSNETLHDTSLKGYPAEYQVAKYMDELIPLQTTTNFYFNPNQARQQKNIREHIIKQVENILLKRTQSIKNWVVGNSRVQSLEPYLNEWALKDLIQNMGYFPNLLKQLDNFQAKLYYQVDDKFLKNLQPKIESYQQEQQKQIEIMQAEKLLKFEKNQQIEKIIKIQQKEPDFKKIIDIQIVRQLALRQLIRYDPKQKNYIRLFLGRPIQQEIVDEYFKKVQSVMIEISMQYDETKQNFQLKRSNKKKFEDLYEISMPDQKREPDVKIEDASDPKYLDDGFARLLAHQHTITPIAQLEQYVNLIYGRPQQRILVQEFLNRVKFHQQKIVDQIEMQTSIIVSCRQQSKYNKSQQFSQLQKNLSAVYSQQETDQQMSWDKNMIDDIAHQYFTNHLIKAHEEFFNFKKDNQIIEELTDAQNKNIKNKFNQNTNQLYYEYLTKIDPQKVFNEQAMGRTPLGNLKIILGYPDTQILIQYQTLITNGIKSLLEKYRNHLKKYQDQQNVLNQENKKQQQLFFNRNELIYCEFGKGVFGKGFKILNIKLLKSNQDVWSKQITDDILQFTQWKSFVGKQFKRFRLFKHTYFNTFFENVDFESIKPGYEMQNDSNDILVFIVNVSQKNSLRGFKSFFQNSFKQRDLISFLMVILYEDQSLDDQKNIQYLLDEANKFKFENVIIQKNKDKKIPNSTPIITEKVGEIIQTRIKQEDQIKLIFIDLFYDFNEFSKKLKDQYGSHIDNQIIEDNFYNYFNKKCPIYVSFNREFFKELFSDFLKNEIAFFQMTQDELIIQIMKQYYKINRQLKHIKNFEFYVKEFTFDTEPQIEQNDCYQILITNGVKIYKTKFQNIQKNKIIFKESLYFDMKDGDVLQFKLNSYYHQKIASMSQQNADQFLILSQERQKMHFQMAGSQFYKCNGKLEVSVTNIPDQYDDEVKENLQTNSKDQEYKTKPIVLENEANDQLNQIVPIINLDNNENYQTIFNKKQKNEINEQDITQDQQKIKLQFITKLLNQKQELNKLIMTEKEAQNIKNMYNIKKQMANQNQTINKDQLNLEKEVNDKQLELESKKEELKLLQDGLNLYYQKCQMYVIQYIVSVVNQKQEIIQDKFKTDNEFNDQIEKLLAPRVNMLNQLINCKQILLCQQQNVKNGFQQYIDFIKQVRQEYIILNQIKTMKIDKQGNNPKILRQRELQEISDKILQEIDKKTDRKFEQILDELEAYVSNLKQAQEASTQNRKNDENIKRQALINQKKILNEDSEQLQKQLDLIKKEKIQISEKIMYERRLVKENEEKLNKLIKIKEEDDKKDKGSQQIGISSQKKQAVDKIVDDVDDRGDKNDNKIKIETRIQKQNEKLQTQLNTIEKDKEKYVQLQQDKKEILIQDQLDRKKKEIQEIMNEFQILEKKNNLDNQQNQTFEDLKKKFDEVEKNYILITCQPSYVKKKIYWIDIKSYQNQIQQIRDEIKQDKISEEQLVEEFRKIPDCSKVTSIEQYFKEIQEECSIIIKKYNNVSNEQKKQKFQEEQGAKIDSLQSNIQNIEKSLHELKQKQSQLQNSSNEAEKAKERNSVVKSLLDKKLTETQKQCIQDYYIELTRTLTLHFNKALSIINDLFQAKQSSVDSALQQIGDIVPIPFFKTAFEIIRQLNSLYETYKDAKEGHQLKKFSALFPTSTVLDTVFSNVANELSRDRKELLIQTQPIEKNKLEKIMKKLQEKFVEEDFYEEVDHGAKQMAHIDAALLISICMQNFSDMYRPKEIQADDIYNIGGKVKILVSKANEASKNNPKLFEDVQTTNSKKNDDVTIDKQTAEKPKPNANERKSGCKTCSIQ